MPADTRTEEQKLVDGLLQATTEREALDMVQASSLSWEPKTMALAMVSFTKLMDLEKRLRWLERDLDRRFFELEEKLRR